MELGIAFNILTQYIFIRHVYAYFNIYFYMYKYYLYIFICNKECYWPKLTPTCGITTHYIRKPKVIKQTNKILLLITLMSFVFVNFTIHEPIIWQTWDYFVSNESVMCSLNISSPDKHQLTISYNSIMYNKITSQATDIISEKWHTSTCKLMCITHELFLILTHLKNSINDATQNYTISRKSLNLTNINNELNITCVRYI
jgi:hypothetical protein